MNVDVRELRGLFEQALEFVSVAGWVDSLPVAYSATFTPDRVGATEFELRLEPDESKVRITLLKTFTDSQTAKTFMGPTNPVKIPDYFRERLADPDALNRKLVEGYMIHFEYAHRSDDASDYHTVYRRSVDDRWFEQAESRRVFRRMADGTVLVRRFGSEHERKLASDDADFVAVSADPSRAISEEQYWRKRLFDGVFGVGNEFSAFLETAVSPREVKAFLDRNRNDESVSIEVDVQRVKDLPDPVFFDGFAEDAIQVLWDSSDMDERSYSELFDQALRLAKWDDVAFGAVWVGKRPSIVWDDTGLHVLVDHDFVSRLPGSMLLEEVSRRKFKFRDHSRNKFRLPKDISQWEQNVPTPKSRLAQRVDWVETIESAGQWDTYLNRQESADAVLAVVNHAPGRTIYSIDQAVYVPRLHPSLRLPDILDHLEETGAVRTEPGQKARKLYYPT